MVQSKSKTKVESKNASKNPSKTKLGEKKGTPVHKTKSTPSEHARLAAVKRAEQKGKLDQSPANLGRISSGAEKQKDLYAWIQSIPLSQDVVKIERDFSDGTLVAEVIHHYCPDLCDKRSYFRWYSSVNKVSNWRLLNFKVFPKMGFQINERQIHSLMHPFSCGKFERHCDKAFIHKLLFKIRDVLAELNPAVNEYKKKTSNPTKSSSKKSVKKLAQPMFRKRPKVHGPMYSKVEMLLEQGFYDKKPEDKDKDKEGDTPSEDSTAKAKLPTEGPKPRQDPCRDMQRDAQTCEYGASSCSNMQMQRRYTTVEDATTLFVRPSYCMPAKCVVDEDPCYHCCFYC